MEEQPNDTSLEIQDDVINPILCVHCKNNLFEAGFPTKLCLECREHFVKYPIPKWIWLFAGGILLMMVIGMIRMPKYISAAYHLSRAEKAIERHAYYTAQKELLLVIENTPENVVANGNLLIAAAHNHNYMLAGFAFQKIAGKKLDDNELYASVQSAMQLVEENYPSDTTVYGKIAVAKDSVDDLKQIYNFLVAKNNLDQYVVGVYVADKLYEKELYKDAEQILEHVLKNEPDFYPAIGLMIAVKRNLGQYDQANAFCDQLLTQNCEDVIAYTQKARVEIKRKDDVKAAEYAAKAMEIDPTSLYAMEAQAMVDHYANRKVESKKLWLAIQQQEAGGDTTITMRLGEIINGKKQYR